MSRHRRYDFWVLLTSILMISGCFSAGTYTMDRTLFDHAMSRPHEERRRTAVPARSSDTGQSVWLTGESLENAEVHSMTGTQLQLEARSPDYATPIGAALLAVGLPLVTRGGMLLARNGKDDFAWLVGADGPGGLLGVGIVGALSGLTLVALGRAIAWQEIKPRRPGWIYVPSRN